MYNVLVHPLIDSGDYILLESQVQLDDGLDDRQVQIVFVVDALALEPDETLKLVLTPRQNFANSNEFLVDTIELIIEDSDGKSTAPCLNLH